jgi:hypothetical protein
VIILHRETKSSYEFFKPFYTRLNALSNEATTPLPRTSILVKKGFQPINLALNMDMKAIWNVIGLGGAAKRDEYPCYCCAIKSEDLWLPGGTVCTTWCVGVVFENNKREVETSGKLWSCYH